MPHHLADHERPTRRSAISVPEYVPTPNPAGFALNLPPVRLGHGRVCRPAELGAHPFTPGPHPLPLRAIPSPQATPAELASGPREHRMPTTERRHTRRRLVRRRATPAR